jgi:hypothetical protein
MGEQAGGFGKHGLVMDVVHPQLSHNRFPMDGALVGAPSHNPWKGQYGVTNWPLPLIDLQPESDKTCEGPLKSDFLLSIRAYIYMTNDHQVVKDPCKYALSTHLMIKAFNPECQLTPKMPDKCKHDFLLNISNCYLSDNNCIKNFTVWPIVLCVGLQKVPSVNTLIGSCTNQVRIGCVHVSSRVL